MELKIEALFGKTAQMTVLKNLLSHKTDSNYLSGIALETGLSHSSVSRVIVPLVNAGIVTESQLGKQIRLFTWNASNPIANLIARFIEEIESGKSEVTERGFA